MPAAPVAAPGGARSVPPTVAAPLVAPAPSESDVPSRPNEAPVTASAVVDDKEKIRQLRSRVAVLEGQIRAGVLAGEGAMVTSTVAEARSAQNSGPCAAITGIQPPLSSAPAAPSALVAAPADFPKQAAADPIRQAMNSSGVREGATRILTGGGDPLISLPRTGGVGGVLPAPPPPQSQPPQQQPSPFAQLQPSLVPLPFAYPPPTAAHATQAAAAAAAAAHRDWPQFAASAQWAGAPPFPPSQLPPPPLPPSYTLQQYASGSHMGAFPPSGGGPPVPPGPPPAAALSAGLALGTVTGGLPSDVSCPTPPPPGGLAEHPGYGADLAAQAAHFAALGGAPSSLHTGGELGLRSVGLHAYQQPAALPTATLPPISTYGPSAVYLSAYGGGVQSVGTGSFGDRAPLPPAPPYVGGALQQPASLPPATLPPSAPAGAFGTTAAAYLPAYGGMLAANVDGGAGVNRTCTQWPSRSPGGAWNGQGVSLPPAHLGCGPPFLSGAGLDAPQARAAAPLCYAGQAPLDGGAGRSFHPPAGAPAALLGGGHTFGSALPPPSFPGAAPGVVLIDPSGGARNVAPLHVVHFVGRSTEDVEADAARHRGGSTAFGDGATIPVDASDAAVTCGDVFGLLRALLSMGIFMLRVGRVDQAGHDAFSAYVRALISDIGSLASLWARPRMPFDGKAVTAPSLTVVKNLILFHQQVAGLVATGQIPSWPTNLCTRADGTLRPPIHPLVMGLLTDGHQSLAMYVSQVALQRAQLKGPAQASSAARSGGAAQSAGGRAPSSATAAVRPSPRTTEVVADDAFGGSAAFQRAVHDVQMRPSPRFTGPGLDRGKEYCSNHALKGCDYKHCVRTHACLHCGGLHSLFGCPQKDGAGVARN